VRILTTVPECRIDAIDLQLLAYPIDVLNLTVRAFNCLRGLPSIDSLLAQQELELIHKRNFGRTSMLDVRRRLVQYCIDQLGLPPAHPIRKALYDPHPALKAVWEAPPQERPLREVVTDILDCLARAEEIREVKSWPASPTCIGPPKRCDYATVSLSEVWEAFFNCLKERELRIVEMRYGPLDTYGSTLAEVGQELGLTRERVRQIVQHCLNRLMKEDECQRREPLTRTLREFVAGRGDVVREQDVAHFLINRFPAPHREIGPLVRVLLEVEPHYAPAGQGVWVAGDYSPATVAEVQDLFHSLLRAAGARQPVESLLAELRRKYPPVAAVPESFLRACLRTDDRLASDETGQYGLIEWQWLLPRTLDDYVYLALRAAARPRHYMWITQQVNGLIPDGEEVTPRDVHGTLLDRSDLFTRYREGTYTLREWENGPRETLGEMVSSILREHGRPMTVDEIVSQVGRVHRLEAVGNGHSLDASSVAALLDSTSSYWRTPDGRYGLNDWPLRRPEAGLSAEAVS
jgi:hypothetical protein